jgi:uncharacterized metal-binding protein
MEERAHNNNKLCNPKKQAFVLFATGNSINFINIGGDGWW